MIEIVKFIFSDFWHWLGAFIMLCTLLQGCGWIVQLIWRGIAACMKG